MDLRPHASVAATPPLVALLGWGLWTYRGELPGLAFWADTITVVVAFTIGAMIGEGTPSRSLAERVFRRVEHGGLAVIASILCVFAFANARLESSLGSAFFVQQRTVPLFAAILLGAAGLGSLAAAAIRTALVSLPRASLGLASVTTVFAMALAAKGLAPTRPPVDRLDAALTSETPPIDIHRRAHHFVVDGESYEYVALGDSCTVVGDGRTQRVEPTRVEDGFAHCPPLDIARTVDGTIAVFVLKDVDWPVLVGELISGEWAPNLSFGPHRPVVEFHESIPMIAVLGMNAPSTSLVRSHRVDGFEVTQDGSRLDSCLVEVRLNGTRLVSERVWVFRQSDPVTICPGVETRLVATMGVVSIRGVREPKVTLEGSPTNEDELAGRVRAPDAYRALPIAGSLVAFAALVAGMSAVVARRRLQGFRTAYSDGTGIVRLDDGRRVRIDPPIAVRSGLVAIRGVIAERPEAGYRESAGHSRANLEVLSASVAELERRHGEVARTGVRAAFAVALAGSVLSLVAWFALGHL